jgi:hypothetical protein
MLENPTFKPEVHFHRPIKLINPKPLIRLEDLPLCKLSKANLARMRLTDKGIHKAYEFTGKFHNLRCRRCGTGVCSRAGCEGRRGARTDAAKDHRPISGALPKRPARDNGGRCRLHHRRNSETPARARGRRQDAACIELTAAFRRLRALRPVVGCKPPSASFLTGCFMTRRLSLRRS